MTSEEETELGVRTAKEWCCGKDSIPKSKLLEMVGKDVKKDENFHDNVYHSDPIATGYNAAKQEMRKRIREEKINKAVGGAVKKLEDA